MVLLFWRRVFLFNRVQNISKIKIIKINSIIKFIIGYLNLLLNIFKFILRDNKIDRKNKNFNSLNNSQEIAFYSCNSFFIMMI